MKEEVMGKLDGKIILITGGTSGICSSSVKLRSVQVDYKRISCCALHLHSSKISHPVMGMNKVEIIRPRHNSTNLGEFDDLSSKIAGVEILVSGEESEVCLMHFGEEQFSLACESDIARCSFFTGIGLQIHRSIADGSETLIHITAFHGFNLLVAKIVDANKLETFVGVIRLRLRDNNRELHFFCQCFGDAHTGNTKTTVDKRWKFPSQFKHFDFSHSIKRCGSSCGSCRGREESPERKLSPQRAAGA